MSIANIKAAIKTNLDELVSSGTLGGATTTQLKQDPLSSNVGTYPHAFVMPPAVASEVLDNRNIIRTYTFDIVVFFQAEDLDTTAELETAIENILSKFDNDPTLGGNAEAGVPPSSSTPEPFQHQKGDMVMVVLQLQARDVVQLTFS